MGVDRGGAAGTGREARIQEGVNSLGPTASGLPPVLMGSRLAARMMVFTGDTITLIAFENIHVDVMGLPTPSMRQYEVTGTLTTGMYDYDMENIYFPSEAAPDQLDILVSDRVAWAWGGRSAPHAAAQWARRRSRAPGRHGRRGVVHVPERDGATGGARQGQGHGDRNTLHTVVSDFSRLAALASMRLSTATMVMGSR